MSPDVSTRYVVKPRVGKGSSGISIVTADKLFQNPLDKSMVIQPLYHGDEYTAGIFTPDRGNSFVDIILKRKLRDGRTLFAERIINKQISKQLHSIASNLNLPYLNVQFFLSDLDAIVPFEFNGRFSGTTGCFSPVLNFPEIYIKNYFLGEQMSTCIVNDQTPFKLLMYVLT
jgi:carbamoylphosphate synthase large subunit